MDHAPGPHPVILAITRITRRKPADIAPHLSLATLGMSSSFGLSALRSQMERHTGTRLPPLDVNMTVAAIIALLDGGPPPTAAAAAPQAAVVPRPSAAAAASANLANIGLGMDMQDIDTFPQVTDYRADPFYAAQFDASEIATGLLRPDTRAHLCGVFCAKEAARKSHPALLALRMTDLLVSHDPAGRPLLQIKPEAGVAPALTLLITITHTDRTAAATCLTLGDPLGA